MTPLSQEEHTQTNIVVLPEKNRRARYKYYANKTGEFIFDRFWIFLFTIALSLSIAYVANEIRTPIFESRSRVQLDEDIDRHLPLFRSQKIFEQLFQEPEIQNFFKWEADYHPASPSDFLERLKNNLTLSTRVSPTELEIRFRDSNPRLATLVVNLLPLLFEKNSSADIEFIAPAVLPSFPIKPQKTLNLILGLIGGILLGFLLSRFFKVSSEKKDSLQEIEKQSGLPILGIIPEPREKERIVL